MTFRNEGHALFLFGDAMDSLVYFGDALKALDDNGKVGGYLVRFSDGSKKDLSGEYFTAQTYLGAHDGDGVDTVFHHGQPLPIKARLTKDTAVELERLREHVFAPIKAKRDAIGIWAETVFDMADEYEKIVFGGVKAGKFGWSSGALGHLVKKSADGEILRWVIGEASITPTPCEPMNRAVAVKSLDAIKFVSVIEVDEETEPLPVPDKPTGLAAKLNQHIEDLVDDKGTTREVIIAKMAKEASLQPGHIDVILKGDGKPSESHLKAFARVLNVDFNALKTSQRKDHQQTIKGMFEDELAGITPSRWELDSAYCCVIKKLANAALGARVAGLKFDWEGKVEEATAEYTSLLKSNAITQIDEWMADGGDDEFYLKAIVNPTKDILSGIPIDLSDHSEMLVNGLKSVIARFRGNHEKRVAQKAGRQLSEKNRNRLAEWIKQIQAAANDAQALLEETQPMASEESKRAAITKHLARKAKHRASLIGV